MKKYFLYELKKNWLVALVLTALALMIYLTQIIVTDFAPIINTIEGVIYTRIPGSPAMTMQVILIGLCTVVPVLMFAFKMSPVQTDCFYSMPIRREKLYLVKSLVGLLLALVPYTIAYWFGFIGIVIKENAFNLAYFVPLYFISLPLALLLFGINAFAFTRANRTVDGVVFMLIYAFVAVALISLIFEIIPNATFSRHYWSFRKYNAINWSTYSPFFIVSGKYNSLISYSNYYTAAGWGIYLFAGLVGIAAWVGIFLTVRREKVENAGRISDSLFGYRVLIPYFLVVLIAVSLPNLSSLYGTNAIITVGLLVSAVVAYIFFRRSVKLKLEDLIALGGAFILGIILAIILNILN